MMNNFGSITSPVTFKKCKFNYRRQIITISSYVIKLKWWMQKKSMHHVLHLKTTHILNAAALIKWNRFHVGDIYRNNNPKMF